MRSGYGRSIFEPLLPIILGRDVSGEVAAIGASVRSLSVGQEVFGALHPTAVRGTYTDYAVLSEEEVTPKPKSLSHVVCILFQSVQKLLLIYLSYLDGLLLFIFFVVSFRNILFLLPFIWLLVFWHYLNKL